MELMNDPAFLQRLAKKVEEDAQFKKILLENPTAGLETFLGRRVILPEGMKIAIVDQTEPSTIFINLPSTQNTEDVELTEEQLDIVSGGVDGGLILKP
ncbi:NHLP leader peptide family RiPP precursor [Hymenobacter rigui]|uniref:NHLP leader peptide family natural product n=1 Tax=Hymenobacter rigui TaxID=334424 RepID=A0A3R9NHW1_9BACT|nr:NHLP leader peptide family RiPP precursor [Hymenobacter rigui]RSK47559.1 NHLP leader peptide family natural product precursor [Hymenobacter rigui]